MKLVIVESPGKIKKIQEILGPEYIVMASVGHIIDLSPSTMSINLETFEPEYVQYPDKRDTCEKLISGVKRVGPQNVYLAADKDREGEMIAWSLERELNIYDGKRIVFTSITEKEIKKALLNPSRVNMNIVYAQQTRRILDRLAGYMLSPLFKVNGMKDARSAGRVQSVVVKLIVEKERVVQDFFQKQQASYFYINCLLAFGEYEILTKLVANDGLEPNSNTESVCDEDIDMDVNMVVEEEKKQTQDKTSSVTTGKHLRFSKDDEEQVITIIKTMGKKCKYVLNDLKSKITKSYPPPPFTTSTLQQYSSNKLNMDSKKTMSVAQKLYEKGHITYMRTDSQTMSADAVKAISKVVGELYGAEYSEPNTYDVSGKKKAKTQEAHECIRPTKMIREIPSLTDNCEIRLYEAIWKRAVQSQMKCAQYQTLLFEFLMFDKKHILRPYKLNGSIQNLIFAGWTIVDGQTATETIDDSNILSIKTSGSGSSNNEAQYIEINGIEDVQKPPSRYNEASLINKLEPKNLNIGRPSTTATVLDKIKEKGYVCVADIAGTNIELKKYVMKASNPNKIDVVNSKMSLGKESKRLVPTNLGIVTTDFLESNFQLLMNYSFTASMEKELDDIAEGRLNKFSVCKQFFDYLQSQIRQIVPSGDSTGIGTDTNNVILGTANSGHEIRVANGKYGKYLICGDRKMNIRQLLEEFKTSNKPNIDSSNVEMYPEYVVELVNLKLEQVPNTGTGTDTGFQIQKEWSKPKSKKKYVLKNGKFGYYVEETNSKGDKQFWSMNFLIKKTAQTHNLSLEDLNTILDKITIEDVLTNIEYLKESKKSNNQKTGKNK